MHSGSLRPEHLIQQLGNCRILHKSLWTQLPHNISLIQYLKYSLLLTPNLNLFPSLHPWASPGLNVICHSHGPQWWKVTRCTESMAIELNTGRKRQNPMGRKALREQWQGVRCACCCFCACSLGVLSSALEAVEWGLCMGSSALAGASHPSLLCCS